MTPGLYADIPFEEYLAAPGISKHGLDLIARSPLHYQQHEPTDSPAMALGRAVHCAVLEAVLLTGGHTEITAYWEDPKTGLPCRARPDYLNDDMTLAVDLKTCASAAPGAFSRAVNNYRYHVQDGWYQDGLKMLGCPVEHFAFICVENTPPYAVACYVLEPAAVDLGRELYRRELQTYATCKQKNRWPGYSGRNRNAEATQLGLQTILFRTGDLIHASVKHYPKHQDLQDELTLIRLRREAKPSPSARRQR